MNDKIMPPGDKRIRPITTPQTQKPQAPEKSKENSFQKILDKTVQGERVQFSKHAQERLDKRSIDLTEKELDRLDDAVDKVAEKGSKESLVVMGDNAYVVSVKNRVVITAMDGSNLKDNVFTNIDSAIILD